MDTENSGEMISSNTTSESSLKQIRERAQSLTSEWLLRFATNCGQPLGSDRVALWRDEFSEFEPDVLEAAFRAVLHEHVFSNFPMVGEIYGKACELRDAKRQMELDRRSATEARAAHERWLTNGPSCEDLRRRQLKYCEEMGQWYRTLLKLQRTVELKPQAEPLVVITTPARLAELDEQRREILARYPNSVA